MSTIANGARKPLFSIAGDVPDVSGALQSYYQHMVFERISKVVNGYQVAETGVPINFRGVVQPFTERQLLLKPEGERAWTWLMVHSDPTLKLNVDDIGIFHGMKTRVMSRKNFTLYGFIEYHMVQDWIGAGP